MKLMRRGQRSLTRLFLAVSLLTVSLPHPAAQRVETRSKPRLVLLLVVDQFRYDYLERFGDLFGPGGFRRLLQHGASWVDANYDYVPTYTAPGHAAMLTGAPPAGTGIVANEWIERETNTQVTSVTDSSVKSLGGGLNEVGYSPRRLLASTVGDEMRLATNDRSKVIGISLKPRSAILPAGRHANGAYWFSTQSGSMTSSTYYFKELPNWVSDFNRARPADKYFGAKWEHLLPTSEYIRRAGPDTPVWENLDHIVGDTNAFPHIITGGARAPGPAFYTALDYSPFSNDLLVEFTKQTLVNEKLGQGGETDVLTLSLSANDYVGHHFGPYSHEVMDVTLRVDRQIATLLDFIDNRIGLQNTLVVFTADHGAAPIPEHASVMGLDGRRIRFSEILDAANSAISARYNRGKKTPDPTADYIFTYDYEGSRRGGLINANLYFNLKALERDGINLDEIEQVAGEAILRVPGIARYFTRAQLLRGAVPAGDPIARRVLNGFYSTRSGDLVIIQEPFKYLTESADAATHGTGYSYDTHVPLVIMGQDFQPGIYSQSATPTDIAATIAAALRIQAPSNSIGRILLEALVPGKEKAGVGRSSRQ